MIGNNELRLNEATMIEAVQFWLDSQLKTPLVVSSVRTGSQSAYEVEFIVSLTGAKPI